MNAIPETIRSIMLHCGAVGSRATCNPAPTDTDADYLVLMPKGSINQSNLNLWRAGWRLLGSHVKNENDRLDGGEFYSYRRGDINLILTESIEFHGKFLAATSVAKRLNLLDKSDRVALFQAVLYGNSTSEYAP